MTENKPASSSRRPSDAASSDRSARQCSACGSEMDNPQAALCDDCLVSSIAAVEQDAHERFGDYELLDDPLLGGMGAVYRARHIPVGRTVALKVIRPEFASDRKTLRRFQMEASLAGSLDHPHIVSIYEIGEHDGKPYMSMPWIEGLPLDQVIRTRFIAPRQAAEIVAQIAAAVQHAHERGVLHRDLKPGNVILDSQARPFLTDFGLAKLRETETHLTHPDVVLGTPHYMSPEQASGKPQAVTIGTDIYGLGALLYELLTGQPPFSGGSPLEILQKVRQEDPKAPRTLNHKVPGDLETICLKCIEKDPSRRYPSAAAVAQDLRRWLAHKPIEARPVSTWERVCKWTCRHPAVSGLMVLVAAVAALGLAGIIWQWDKAVHASRLAETANQGMQDSLIRLRLQAAETSRNSGVPGEQLSRLAAILRSQPTNQIAKDRLLSVLGQRNYLLPAVAPMFLFAEATHIQFSPDGQRLATCSIDGRVMVYNTADASIHCGPMNHGREASTARFSPNGRRLLTCSDEQDARLWNLDPNDGSPGDLIGRLGFPEARVQTIDYSPLGNLLATGTSDGRVHVWHTTNLSAPLWTARHAGSISASIFHPRNDILLTASADGTARLWNGSNGNPLGQTMEHPGPLTHAIFSRDGSKLATCVSTNVYLWDDQGRRLTGPIQNRGQVNSIDFSPDGTRLATATSVAGIYTPAAAWIWNVNSGALIAGPMQHQSEVFFAEFSPDGLLLLTGSWDQSARLWDARDGSALTEPLIHQGAIHHGAFSPNGKFIATSSQDRTVALWEIRLGRPRQHWFQHASDLTGLDLHPDQSTVLTTDTQGRVTAWNIHTGGRLHSSWLPEFRVEAAFFTSEGQGVAYLAAEGFLQTRSLKTGEIQTAQRQTSGPLDLWHLQEDGSGLALANDQGQIELWSLSPKLQPRTVFSEPIAITSLSLSRDGTRLLASDYKGKVHGWNTSSGQPLFDPVFHFSGTSSFPRELTMNMLRQVMQTQDTTAVDKLLEVSTEQKTNAQQLMISVPDWVLQNHVRLLSTTNQDLKYLLTANDTLPKYFQQMTDLKNLYPMARARFSPDGRQFVTASYDGQAFLRNAQSGQVLHGPFTHRSPVLDARYSPDGRMLATASSDYTARLWDTQTAKALTEELPHEGPVIFALFNPDGRKLATFSATGQAYLWDAKSGFPLSDPMPHPGSVRQAQFTKDGQRLLTVCSDNYLRVWEIPSPSDPAPPFFLTLAEALAGKSIRDGVLGPKDISQLHRIVQQRRHHASDNYYNRWAQWFVSNSPTNPISPNIAVTEREYLEHVTAQDQPDSLAEAALLRGSSVTPTP